MDRSLKFEIEPVPQGNAWVGRNALVRRTPEALAKPDAKFDEALIRAVFANSYRVLAFYISRSTQGAALGYELANACGVGFALFASMPSSSFDTVSVSLRPRK